MKNSLKLESLQKCSFHTRWKVLGRVPLMLYDVAKGSTRVRIEASPNPSCLDTYLTLDTINQSGGLSSKRTIEKEGTGGEEMLGKQGCPEVGTAGSGGMTNTQPFLVGVGLDEQATRRGLPTMLRSFQTFEQAIVLRALNIITSRFAFLAYYPINPIFVNCCEKKHEPLATSDGPSI